MLIKSVLIVKKIKLTQEQEDKENFENYVKKLLNINRFDLKLNTQVKTFKEQYNYTYSGMYKALKYFYEIKGNDIKKANGGIGIIPYIYKQAQDYFLALWEAQQKNESKIEVIQSYVPQVKEIRIKRPQLKPRRKDLFTFLDEEEVNNEQ